MGHLPPTRGQWSKLLAILRDNKEKIGRMKTDDVLKQLQVLQPGVKDPLPYGLRWLTHDYLIEGLQLTRVDTLDRQCTGGGGASCRLSRKRFVTV